MLLVDDHSVMRDGLRLMVEGPGEFEVVRQARDGEEVVQVASDTLSGNRPRAFGACTATGLRWKSAARRRFTAWMLLMLSGGPRCCPIFAWFSADRSSVRAPARGPFLLQSSCGDYRK